MTWICPPAITANIDRQLAWWERPVQLAATLVGAPARRWCDLVWWLTLTPTARDRILHFAADGLTNQRSEAERAPARAGLKLACPVCRVPLHDERGRSDICHVCWWEDDGIDDEDWPSGCNSGLTLAEACANFTQTMLHGPPGHPSIARMNEGEPDLTARRQAIVELAARIHGLPDGPELTVMAGELDR